MINFNEISEGLEYFEKIRQRLQIIAAENTSRFQENDIRSFFPNQLNRLLIFNDLNLAFFENIIKNKNALHPIMSFDSDGDHFQIMES